MIKLPALDDPSEEAQQAAFMMLMGIVAAKGFAAAEAFMEGRPIIDMPMTVDAREMCVEFLHAIPNGGTRGSDPRSARIAGAAMKASGVKAGVPDLFFPLPMGEYAGLYIEFKSPRYRNTRDHNLSSYQLKFIRHARLVAYRVDIVFNWREAFELVKSYVITKPLPIQTI
jgi:hypothetical protein